MQRIAVIGVGTVGSFALLELSRRPGVMAVGYETYAPGHDRGAAGGENRLITRALALPSSYDRVLAVAQEGWRSLEEAAQRQLIESIGHMIVGDEESRPMRDLVERYGDVSGIRVMKSAQLREEMAFQSYSSSDVAVHDSLGGVIRTDASIVAATTQARENGAEVHTNTRVTGLREVSGGVEVVTASGGQRFDQVIVATGAWVRELLPEHSATVEVFRPVSAWYLPLRGKHVAASVCAFERSTPHQFYGAPTFDRQAVKLGYGGVRQRRIQGTPTAEDYYVDAAEASEFDEIVSRFLPGLHPDAVRRQAFFEGYTASTDPVLGRIDERRVVAAGFSGRGFKFAPVFGRVAAELAQYQKPSVELAFVREGSSKQRRENGSRL